MKKPEYRPERAEEFSKMLLNTFRYKMADKDDITVLASVCKSWSELLEAGNYPPTLMSLTLVSAKVPD